MQMVQSSSSSHRLLDRTTKRRYSTQSSTSPQLSTTVQRWCITILLFSGMMAAGCGEAVDPQVLRIREHFLTEKPLGSEQPVSTIRKAIQSGDLKPDTPFTIRVRINAGEVSPFSDGVARFFVTDATGHDGDESHDPHECPFCRRDVKSMMALVEFKDDSGKLLRIDARELFGVHEFELLVLEGTGRLDEEEILVVSANRMFMSR